MYQKILLIQYSILIIYTFLKNTKIFKLCVKILESILSKECKDFLTQAFRALHNNQTRFKEQVNAFTYQNKQMFTEVEIK